MAIFLRQSWNVKPPRWGSPADVQYAVKINSEKIYDRDPDNDVLVMPGFWGLPLLDYSGFNNHGTNHGATYKDGSLNFDGANDYVEVSDTNSLDIGTSDFSISVRFKYTQVHQGGLISKKPSLGYNFFINDAAPHEKAYLQASLSDGTNTYVADTDETGGAINDGNWHHAIAVFDRDSNLSLYLDKNIVESGNIIASNGDIGNAGSLKIGSREGTNFFNGAIAEICISNVIYTTNQIALFHDNPWALYQPVSRPVYFLPTEIFVPRIIMF